MLNDNGSIAHFKASNVVIWMLMAFQGGFLNMSGLLACKRFVSHVTGYGTLVAFEVGERVLSESLSYGLVPVFFFLGSMLSGELVDIRIRMKKRPNYFISFGVMFLLLTSIATMGVMGWFGNFGEGLVRERDYVLLIVLAFVCGVQNGTITTVSKSVIRTTHLSGITTDLGLGLVRILHRRELRDSTPDEGKANFMRVGIITFFVSGSYVGYLLCEAFGFLAFIVPVALSGILFSVMLYFRYRPARAL